MSSPSTDPRKMLEALAAFPFAPGTSPFRIKGTGYRGKLEYMDSLPGGRADILAVVGRPEISEFFAQPFLPSIYYDIVPLLTTTAAIAILNSESFETRTRARAKHQAVSDMSGVHRLIMRFAPSKIIAQRIPVAIAQYMNFVEVETGDVGDGKLGFVLRRVPEPVDLWLSVVVATYLETILEAGGTKNVKVEFRLERDEPNADVPTHKIVYQADWK